MGCIGALVCEPKILRRLKTYFENCHHNNSAQTAPCVHLLSVLALSRTIIREYRECSPYFRREQANFCPTLAYGILCSNRVGEPTHDGSQRQDAQPAEIDCSLLPGVCLITLIGLAVGINRKGHGTPGFPQVFLTRVVSWPIFHLAALLSSCGHSPHQI